MDSNAPTPASIGRFRVDAVLGSGGMGAVYKAFDPTLQRTVAVKTVRPDIASPDFIERLIREAQACARLRHPNIVVVYEAGQIDGMVYIVMEYLQGEDLGAALRHGALTFEEKLRALVQVLDALQHSHSEGVIHRDIKPSNVHRQPDGSIKLVDFGLARVETAEPLTRSGALMCTPEYASPEQLRGETLDGRSDVYSVGVVAFEMVTGRRPFSAETFGAVIAKVLTEPLPPMNNRWSRTFPDIERIFTRALEKSTTDRYQSAEEMKSALAAFLNTSHGAIAEAEASFALAAKAEDDSATVVRTPASAGTDSQPETSPTATRVTNDTSRTTTAAPRRASDDTSRTTTAAQAPRDAAVAADRSNHMWRGVMSVAAAAVAIAAIVMSSRKNSTTEPSEPASVAAPASVTASPPTAGGAQPGGADAAAPTTAGAANSTSGSSDSQPPAIAAGASSTGAAPSASTTANKPAPAPAAAGSRTAARAPGAKEMFMASPGASGDEINAGLRFRLTRRTADGNVADVNPATTTFRSGDRVRFAFESNIDAYLYVVQQGSSGRWTLLFPGPKINAGRNAVKKSDEYVVPSNDWFLFDATPGTEHIFVLLSKEPLSELPGFNQPVTKTETVVASVVDTLQDRVQSRDLLLESDTAPTVEDGTPVQATYVVSRAQQGQSVAASITLSHTQ